jgi:uncharacterized protein involved in type VI secretion and phage assembly
MTAYLPNALPHLFRAVRAAQERSDRIYEAVVGIVVDIEDPKKLGRVKVRFPTLPALDIEETSWWAPLAAQGGGKDRGWWFLPELEDEVLVMFEHGDIERPVVIGALWSGVDLPPEKNKGKNERRIIHSREGSRLILDDEQGSITLEDGGGVGRIVITKDRISIEAMSGDVCIQAPKGDLNIVANEIQVTASENAHIQTGKALAVGADGEVTISSSSITANSPSTTFNKGARMASAASANCEDVPDPV